jgi:hypothetical protein
MRDEGVQGDRILPYQSVARTRELPIWLVVVMLAMSLGVGAGGVWWYLMAQTRPRGVTVSMRRGMSFSNRTYTYTPYTPPPLPVGQVAATLVSLNLKAATPQEAFAALSKASEVRINLLGGSAKPSGKPISVVYKNQPFWTVLMDLAQKSGYVLTMKHSSSGSLILEPGSQALRSSDVIHGPFLLRLMRVEQRRQAPLGDQPANLSLSIGARLAWEPTMKPLGLCSVPVVSEAIDDRGQSLMMHYGEIPFSSVGQTWQHSESMALRCPVHPGRRIARLKGYVRVLAKGPKDYVLESSDPLNAKAQRVTVDGIAVEFKSLEKSGSQYKANFVAHGHYQDPRIQYRFTTDGIRLFDDKGGEMKASGGTTGSQIDTYLFSAFFTAPRSGRRPGKLVLTVPTDVKEVRIPFDFKDLPLP